ncbi:PIG-L deacetylase family protein [Clostridium sp. Cult2]|uniref:PIG-L deacetylase family protein n=1 Tax=Clostridium sp. Cult2 TaxID=2079003 RepID=UPI001F3DCC00|nr:PIG-L deacetylase family protein [Clostridium sp. Cult2]
MRVLVIGAHPDDIEPQMGGTIAKLTKNGHEVLILQFTDTGGELNNIRIQESIDAANILGADIKHLHYNQYNFTFDRKTVQSLDKIIEEYKPDEIYTCWEYDSHQDHQAVSKIVLASSRKNNANVFFFEPIIPGGIIPYAFNSNYFVDITDTIEIKIKSIMAHKSQVKKFGNGWVNAIYGRASFRGFQINVKYAEAFQIVKMIYRI